MRVRDPSWAGLFYPAEREACEQQIAACVRETGNPDTPRDTILGGIVPHAGWVYSGMVAATVLAAMAQHPHPRTLVLLGAWHRVRGRSALLCGSERWRTPLGDVEVDEELADRLMHSAPHGLITHDLKAHQEEHSLEVVVPLVQHYFPKARILPILVPPSDKAVELGVILAGALSKDSRDVAILGSTDLTHYGPRYHFTPHGSGTEGFTWAKSVNDRRFIDLMLAMNAECVIPECADHHNACGPGAVAATLAAVRTMGARRGTLLLHTTSHETAPETSKADAVGYAGLVFPNGERVSPS